MKRAKRSLLTLGIVPLMFSVVPVTMLGQDFDAPFPAHRMIGNLYFVGTEGLGSFLIATPDGHILINSNFERTVPTVQRAVAELGFEFEDIEIVLGSHAHGDHMQADALVKELTGARVMAMAEDVPALRAMQPGGKPHPIDRVLEDGDTVTLGGTTLTAVLTPGHTKGCTTWTLEVEEAGQTYDVVIVCSFGVNANYVLVDNPDYPDIADDYVATFATARSLDVDVFLGAHGFWFDLEGKYEQLQNAADGAPNPYVDSAGYREHVDLQEARFRAMLAAQREAAGRRGAADLDEFFEAFAADWVRADPDLAVSRRYFEGPEQERLDRQLTPRTRAHALEAARFEREAMTESERVAAEALEWQLGIVVDSEPYLDYAFPLQQYSGANVGLIESLTVTHPMAAARDVDSYVARMALIDERMREALAEALRRARQGVIPPTFILESTIEEMERFIVFEPAANPLVTTLAEKGARIEGLPERRRADALATAAAIVEDEIYPVWRNALAELRSQLVQSTADTGVWRFRDGPAIYAHALARYTTTSLSADEIHEIGLREVARIEGEMDGLLRQVGLSEGTIQSRIEALTNRLSYANDESGRAIAASSVCTSTVAGTGSSSTRASGPRIPSRGST